MPKFKVTHTHHWLAGLALLLSVSAPSHALSVSNSRSSILGDSDIRLDSAVAGLALSNGSDNPFQPSSRSPLGGPAGTIGALNVMAATVTGDRSAPVSATNTMYGSRVIVSERYTTVIQPVVRDIGLDLTTGQFGVVQLDGKVTINAAPYLGVVDGGNLTLSDMKVDLQRGFITADVSSNPGLPYAFNANDVDVFSIGQMSGTTRFDPSGDPLTLSAQGWEVQASDSTTSTRTWTLTGWIEASQLRATDAFLNQFLNSLGVFTLGTGWNVTKSINDTASGWGSLRLGMGMRLYDSGYATPLLAPVVVDHNQMLRPVTNIPEPGTGALMLLGLLGLAAGGQYRRQTTGSHVTAVVG